MIKYTNGKAENIKIAYIGGGSRGWAWGLMSDLVSEEDISGDVYLYDIDYEAAGHNEIIGNKYNSVKGAKTHWNYKAVKDEAEAYRDADFVIISILPGTFDEMTSDVHAPEKYGIYQSVGDTVGPGGIVRAMRCVPMFEHIAEKIKEYCPNAWVINYTNPMTICVKTLYRVFPEIKAFGCCHEVFGTQKLLAQAYKATFGIDEEIPREEIKVTVTGVNHFTWLTSAKYNNIDLFPMYKDFAKKYAKSGYSDAPDNNWFNTACQCLHKVKFDLCNRYGYIAAAGDRHLAEFCEGKWYLKDPDCVESWSFGLTPVSWRTGVRLQERLEKSEKLRSGALDPELECTGEEGVLQIRALLGLCDLVTNVNIPNRGQIANLPLGTVVETNASFRNDAVVPLMTGDLPESIYPLVSRIAGGQNMLDSAIAERDLEKIFAVFANDQLVTCSLSDARKLFKEMIENTKSYLTMYDVDGFTV